MKHGLRVMAVVMLSAGNLLAAGGFDLVRDGKPHAVIVIPAAASPVAGLAAREFQWYVQRATTASLDILREGQKVPQGMGLVYIGPCRQSLAAGLDCRKMPEDSYVVKVSGNALFIVGRDGDGAVPKEYWLAATAASPMGTLYAVYDWLDREAGVRWLWPGELGTYVPTGKSMTSGADGERLVQPRFLWSRLRVVPDAHKEKPFMSQEAYERFKQGTQAWFRHHRFAVYTDPNYGHMSNNFPWWKRFGKTHPEYFALRPDGRRGPIEGDPDYRPEYLKKCVSNPDLQDQVIKIWLSQRRPDKPLVNACEDDGGLSACTCEKCRAWDAGVTSRTGMHSDRYAKFYLALQKKAEKYDPKVKVFALGYDDFNDPPVKTRLNDRILVSLVPGGTRFPDPRVRQDFESYWQGWAATGAKLIFRVNWLYAGYCLPWIFAREFGNDFKFALDHGCVATDFDSLTSMWGVQGPNLYMVGRLHSRPDLGVDDVLTEYYSAFGRAAGSVRAYFDFWQKVTEAEFAKPRPENSWMLKYADDICTPDRLAQARSILEAAKSQAAGDAYAAGRVAFLTKGLEHTRLLIQAIRAWKASRDDFDNRTQVQAFRNALAELDAFRRQIQDDFVVNLYWARYDERLDFDPEPLDLQLGCRGRLNLSDGWLFRWDTENNGIRDEWFSRNSDLAQRSTPIAAGKTWVDQASRIGPSTDGAIGWYRTKFRLPEAARGKPLFLLFGAVDKSATVWLNGSQLLERKFWAAYDPEMWKSPFVIPIPAEDVLDQVDNELTVRVEGRIEGGGIWKPVIVMWR